MKDSFEIGDDEHGLLEHDHKIEKKRSMFDHLGMVKKTSVLDEVMEQSIIYSARGEIQTTKTEQMNQITFVSVFFICGVIFGGGTITPFTNMFKAHTPIMMNCWRALGNFLVSFPLTGYLIYQDSKTRPLKEMFSTSNIQMIFGVGCCFAVVSSCLIISSTLTVLSHSQVLGSLAGVLLILYKMLTCENLHLYEKLGAALTIFGVLVLLSDKSAKKSDGREASLWGEFFGFMVSVFYVLFFLINSVLVKRLHGLIVYTLMNLVVIFIMVLVILCFSGQGIFTTLSMDLQYGVFGCFSLEKLPVTLLVGSVSGLFGNGSYVMINKYFEPHIASIFFLFQPIVSQMLGLILGLDKLPGIPTWLGFLITSSSIYMITQGSYKRLHEGKESN